MLLCVFVANRAKCRSPGNLWWCNCDKILGQMISLFHCLFSVPLQDIWHSIWSQQQKLLSLFQKVLHSNLEHLCVIGIVSSIYIQYDLELKADNWSNIYISFLAWNKCWWKCQGESTSPCNSAFKIQDTTFFNPLPLPVVVWILSDSPTPHPLLLFCIRKGEQNSASLPNLKISDSDNLSVLLLLAGGNTEKLNWLLLWHPLGLNAGMLKERRFWITFNGSQLKFLELNRFDKLKPILVVTTAFWSNGCEAVKQNCSKKLKIDGCLGDNGKLFKRHQENKDIFVKCAWNFLLHRTRCWTHQNMCVATNRSSCEFGRLEAMFAFFWQKVNTTIISTGVPT